MTREYRRVGPPDYERFSILRVFLDSKLHENLKIRLFYDQIRSQSDFFRVCIEAYLDQNELFMNFLDEEKVVKGIQSRTRSNASKKVRLEGEGIMNELALSDDEIENIFDILEEELPEL
jgi:hypothetical protein